MDSFNVVENTPQENSEQDSGALASGGSEIPESTGPRLTLVENDPLADPRDAVAALHVDDDADQQSDPIEATHGDSALYDQDSAADDGLDLSSAVNDPYVAAFGVPEQSYRDAFAARGLDFTIVDPQKISDAIAENGGTLNQFLDQVKIGVDEIERDRQREERLARLEAERPPQQDPMGALIDQKIAPLLEFVEWQKEQAAFEVHIANRASGIVGEIEKLSSDFDGARVVAAISDLGLMNPVLSHLEPAQIVRMGLAHLRSMVPTQSVRPSSSGDPRRDPRASITIPTVSTSTRPAATEDPLA